MSAAHERLHEHLRALRSALDGVEPCLATVDGWGRHLATCLGSDGRLLVAGNGGSAAQAQHLTSELVGRFVSDRRAFSAIALHADSSATTAIDSDYGAEAVFARQVHAHGRRGDVLLLMSTSGRSANLLDAADAAVALGLRTWALTGPPPTPLAARVDETIPCAAPTTATVQELHQLVIHLLCVAFEAALVEQQPSSNGRRRTGAWP